MSTPANTAFPRDLEALRSIAADLDPEVGVMAFDLSDRAEAEAVATQAAEHLGGLDGALHAMATRLRDADLAVDRHVNTRLEISLLS